MTVYLYENLKVEVAAAGPAASAPAGSSELLRLFHSWCRYVIFLNEQRSPLRARHPDLPFTEITKMLAAQWAQLPPEKKQVSPFLRGMRRGVGLAVCSLD